MKKELLPAIILSVLCMVLFCLVYPAIIWGTAQLSPNKGEGFTVQANGKTYFENIAQKFTDDRYFWSRPSAVDYNAAGSGGSNKGPYNPDLLKQVSDRIDTFMAHDPGIQKSEIPSDMVTASGSGLDPDITIQCAKIQVPRIAKKRGLPENMVYALVSKQTDHPLFGIFGPEKINILKLNIALDNIKN